ncbi:hypothetical protein [Dactylosporangium sp. CA-139066]|uniref:hypothetical protein n=1 Tax=Dactylosporangium sp. CA-139066 TaxID=3239930 RepID=UPI003D8BF9AC
MRPADMIEGMDLLARELPTGWWGRDYEAGVVDGILEAATTANGCVQAFAAAYHAESAGNQEIQEALLAAERSVTAGIRRAAAIERYGALTSYSDALLRAWARIALHLTRVTTTAWHLQAADRAAATDGSQAWLREVEPVSALYATPPRLLRSLAPMPPSPGDATDDWDAERDLHMSYQRIVDAVQIGHAHRTPPELFDHELPGEYDAVAGLGLLDLAEALHDYGAQSLWLLAAQTTIR